MFGFEVSELPEHKLQYLARCTAFGDQAIHWRASLSP